ncbi:hypothetical protein TPB0596_07100 [Tsukamurella pulmonis]|uniref:Uncharacterized protein n=1 Tax=Tsukamurella pulmonis TaxID=47312 RepID=A0A1H1HFM9_9ACTN|nr:hypothetical protein [Tsukamurella pulmonis]KXO94781.1 hypothetical protein AXK56_19405 [Tsukamurella pulmonis]KXP12802.1 hypothetical protein AXK57_00665 [Tsukamurella pulmonis]RDH11777.1 hypothetical protein DVB88_10895 [Tsukamurella pulmonis]SDR23928.1 hypothetical protein SAMN04489765_4114 [Tsukamurella pulmonis]SUP14936.1 Uncharacterised protein [Tsukamurella pulmonis]
METISLALSAVWKVLLVGLILGAGLPALFAVGVRGLAIGNGHETEDGSVRPPNPLGNVLAAIAFVIVVAAVLLGIAMIVASGFKYELTFENIYPWFEKKK